MNKKTLPAVKKKKCSEKNRGIWHIFAVLCLRFYDFEVPGAVKDIILEQKYFNTIFFSCIHSFLTLPQMNWRKKLKFTQPYYVHCITASAFEFIYYR